MRAGVKKALGAFYLCGAQIVVYNGIMRGFWRLSGSMKIHTAIAVILAIQSPFLFAKFEQTSGTKTDASKFGGMSDAEVEQLARQIQSEYTASILRNIKKFDEGDKSSKFDGQGSGGSGRYSGYGEAHITKGDGMISHEGGANALERAVELGALGQLGLSGQARIDAEKKIMEANTVPVLGSDGKTILSYRNKLTGQMQSKPFEISAAMYDAGPAHGSGPQAADDPHRVYAIKPEVRVESEKNGTQYASKTIQDATLARGKQPNLDLLHKAFSKMEQDKYIMMATDAFAFKSARLDETDTTDPSTKNTIAEYKQLAIDTYAKYPGDIATAEKEIQGLLAKRVAEKKVINNKGLCWNGDVNNGNCPTDTSGVSKTSMTPDGAARAILRKLGASEDGTNIEAIKKDIIRSFAKDDRTQQPKATEVNISDLMQNVKLRSLSGVLSSEQLTAKYEQAKQGMKSDELAKIGQYEQRLKANECLSFTGFCYVKEWAPANDPRRTQQNQTAVGATGIDKDDPNEFQKLSGDPGAHFRDTREFIYNKFAYAYNRPLAEWKGIVTNLDFNENTDKNIKDKGLYKEFNEMYESAMKAATNTQQNTDRRFVERLKSAGATPEQIAKIRPNYSVNFDPQKMTFMQLYGQNKDRDAIMMDWRKGTGNKFYNPNIKQNPSAPTPPLSIFTNNPSQNRGPSVARP